MARPKYRLVLLTGLLTLLDMDAVWDFDFDIGDAILRG
jgi:hypothetical protein